MGKIFDYGFKIILIGPPGVGKTSLVNKFVERKFQEEYLPTVGANIMATQTTATIDAKEYTISLMIWDIAAQDSFKPMRASFYSGTKGAFIVGDLTNPQSLESLVNWNEELMKYVPPIPKILLANKSDLQHTISMEALETLGKQIQTTEVLKTSALEGDNVKQSFRHLAGQILEEQLKKKEMARSKKDARVKSAMQYLYVLSLAGIVVFEHDFARADEIDSPTDGDLLGGALVAISELLKDVAKNKSALKVVRQEGFSILVEEGQEILVALVASEESKPLREKVVAFLGELETKLGPKLQKYIAKGQVIPPQQISSLVTKHFEHGEGKRGVKKNQGHKKKSGRKKKSGK